MYLELITTMGGQKKILKQKEGMESRREGKKKKGRRRKSEIHTPPVIIYFPFPGEREIFF